MSAPRFPARLPAGLLILAALFIAGLVRAENPSGPFFDPYPINGALTIRYRNVRDSSIENNDLYESLALDIGSDNRNRFTFNMFAYGTQDADALRGAANDTSGFFVFEDIADAYPEHSFSRLHYAYMDINRVARSDSMAFDKIRIGRQLLPTIDAARMDGIRYDTVPLEKFGRLTFEVFAGIPVSLHEDTTSGDWLAGLQSAFIPFPNNTVHLEYLHIRDDSSFLGRQDAGVAALRDTHTFEAGGKLDVLATYLDGTLRDITLSYRHFIPSADVLVAGKVYGLFTEIESEPAEFDPFYIQTGTLYPYTHTSLTASQGLGLHLRAEAGINRRKLNDAGDEGAYNHTFTHYYISLLTNDLPWEGLDGTLTWGTWVDSRKDLRTYLGYSFDYRRPHRWETGAGYRYEMFKSDPGFSTAEEEVATYYLYFARNVSSAVKVTLRAELEQNYDDDYWLGSLTLRYSF